MPDQAFDKNGAELHAGSLVKVEGWQGRVNSWAGGTIWVNGRMYDRDPETGRCPHIALVSAEGGK